MQAALAAACRAVAVRAAFLHAGDIWLAQSALITSLSSASSSGSRPPG